MFFIEVRFGSSGSALVQIQSPTWMDALNSVTDELKHLGVEWEMMLVCGVE